MRTSFTTGRTSLLILDGSGNVIERELTGAAPDEVFASENGSTNAVNWYLTDNQGTVRDVVRLVSGTPTVENHLTYAAFGNLTGQTSTAAGDQPTFHYNGAWQDPQTGLNKMGARWADLVDAVFASKDPLGFNSGTINLSEYVGNSPTNFTDPSGMAPIAPALNDPLSAFPIGGGPSGLGWPVGGGDSSGSGTAKTLIPGVGLLYGGDGNTGLGRVPVRGHGGSHFGGGGGAGAPSGFWNSLGKSIYSIGQTYWGMGQWATNNPQWNNTLQNAYDNGIYGQTKDADGLTYYGTRISVGVATGAAALASGALAYDALLATGSGQITLTELYGQTHFVYAETGGTMFNGLGATGSLQVYEVTAAQAPTITYLNTLTIPLRNPGAVTAFSEAAQASGTTFYNCIT